MVDAGADIPRFERPANRERVDPDMELTELERRDIRVSLSCTTRIGRDLASVVKAFEEMPLEWQHELNKRLPNVFLLDIEEADIEAVRTFADELETKLESGRYD